MFGLLQMAVSAQVMLMCVIGMILKIINEGININYIHAQVCARELDHVICFAQAELVRVFHEVEVMLAWWNYF